MEPSFLQRALQMQPMQETFLTKKKPAVTQSLAPFCTRALDKRILSRKEMSFFHKMQPKSIFTDTCQKISKPAKKSPFYNSYTSSDYNDQIPGKKLKHPKYDENHTCGKKMGFRWWVMTAIVFVGLMNILGL